LGLQPKLVACEPTNFKVTYPQDLLLAELLLKEIKDN
jgi:2-C-methyl-D-erythritol 4-phosphate cytidylyltransferase